MAERRAGALRAGLVHRWKAVTRTTVRAMKLSCQQQSQTVMPTTVGLQGGEMSLERGIFFCVCSFIEKPTAPYLRTRQGTHLIRLHSIPAATHTTVAAMSVAKGLWMEGGRLQRRCALRSFSWTLHPIVWNISYLSDITTVTSDLIS